MPSPGPGDLLAQLNQARQVVLENAANYPAIVPSILPIIGANADIELRRWGAEFLAETFASPVLPPEVKQQLCLGVLDKLKEYLEIPGEDVGVVKGVVQAATSIYPLVFRYIINNPTDAPTWQKMAGIKSNILRRMDSAAPGVRICCVKFVQRVVQTQTPGVIADPRRPEQNDISLALVPRDHPLTPPANLEAEASGLLDRLLTILQEEISDVLLITATLNALGSLIRTRATIANKIISTVLGFNPFKLANSPLTPKTKVMIKSIERTVRALLTNVIKKNQQHPLAPRIQQHIERLHHTRLEILDDTNRKRAAPAEPTDGLDNAKRQRLGANVDGTAQMPGGVPPLPPGPITTAQLFTLTQDEALRNFDVQAIPIDPLIAILVPLMRNIDQGQLDNAVNAIRSRYLSRSKTQTRGAVEAAAAATKMQPPADEDDDYEPSLGPTEDAEQIVNNMENGPSDSVSAQRPPPEMALGTFNLPPPQPLTPQETSDYSKGTINRVFGVMAALDDQAPKAGAAKHGFNRLAASSYDRNAWVTVITRIATRASAGLDTGPVKSEFDNAPAKTGGNFKIADMIRDTLYMYVLEDFRGRIDVAISWLNEEWYNDFIQQKHSSNTSDDNKTAAEPQQHYKRLALKVLDGIVPYLESNKVDQKILIRFCSEIPTFDQEMLERVKQLARDPERIGLAVTTILYNVMMRPPVREMCLDALEDLWRSYDGAQKATRPHLAKWRPHVLKQAEEANSNGADVTTEAAAAAAVPVQAEVKGEA
ncbi:hypothetical protein K490DRAFT_73252 [Saccharata proteae CBS 121410]|uniref:Symplekin/Pta1 N-terminal domain-containing protein n=1 Tax=Saccharata proteae CBS 121410 TaxID=1314787 RepID=A0A9P4LXM1_9PEZI|nr:hypothetical protein K490DRAFT_73252 [Saccharata proteae CBS 121410]